MNLKKLFEKKLSTLSKIRNEFAPTYMRAFSALRNSRVDANKFSNIKVKRVSSYKNLLNRIEAARYINTSLANIKLSNVVALKNISSAFNDTLKEIGTEAVSLDKKYRTGDK